MPRNLLILALLVSGTGCSATRPPLSTIVVTPPELSFRQLPRGDSWHWTAVAVTYPSGSLIPAPCAPLPVRPVELVTCFEEDERPAPRSPSGPVPSVTTVVPVPPVNVLAPAPPTLVHLENTTSPQSAHLSVPSVASVPSGITPIVLTASLLTKIRNQRQLIEALQRDLTRERSADDADIEELEAAVENLLVHTQTAPREMPTTLRN